MDPARTSGPKADPPGEPVVFRPLFLAPGPSENACVRSLHLQIHEAQMQGRAFLVPPEQLDTFLDMLKHWHIG